MLQVRRVTPRAGQRDPFYNPERDIAYIGEAIIANALQLAANKRPGDWATKFLNSIGVPYVNVADTIEPDVMAARLRELELIDTMRKFVRSLVLIIGEKSPDTAHATTGFLDSRPEFITLVYAYLGRAMLAAIWSGIKDVASQESTPPPTFQQMFDDIESSCLVTAKAESEFPQPDTREDFCAKLEAIRLDFVSGKDPASLIELDKMIAMYRPELKLVSTEGVADGQS